MNITLKSITPAENEATPLTDMFVDIVVAVHGGPKNVSSDLAAALHILRTVELAAQQLDRLAHTLIDSDPSLSALKERVLAPVHKLGRGMDEALEGVPDAATFQDLNTTLNPN